MMAEEGAGTAVVVDDTRSLIRREQRQGDVISPHRAVLTLSKSMFNAGCFSLPFAWRLGGKWVCFNLCRGLHLLDMPNFVYIGIQPNNYF